MTTRSGGYSFLRTRVKPPSRAPYARSPMRLGMRGSMTDDIDNRLRQLCDLVKVEHDRDKIKALAQDIARLLIEKLERQRPDRKAG